MTDPKVRDKLDEDITRLREFLIEQCELYLEAHSTPIPVVPLAVMGFVGQMLIRVCDEGHLDAQKREEIKEWAVNCLERMPIQVTLRGNDKTGEVRDTGA